MIDEKLEKLSKINQELKEKELNKEETDNSINSNNYEFDFRIIDLLNKTKYQDKNIFEINKIIDEKFDIDYVGLLKEFLKNVQDDGTYQFVTNLRNKFNSDIIYKMKILSDEEQVELLNKNLVRLRLSGINAFGEFIPLVYLYTWLVELGIKH